MPQGKPNILFIMADDIGWYNLSCYNQGVMGYRTPNLDRIAEEGAMFTTSTASKAAPRGAPPSSPDNRRSEQGSPKSGFPAQSLA
jgi:hypothetical protein